MRFVLGCTFNSGNNYNNVFTSDLTITCTASNIYREGIASQGKIPVSPTQNPNTSCSKFQYTQYTQLHTVRVKKTLHTVVLQRRKKTPARPSFYQPFTVLSPAFHQPFTRHKRSRQCWQCPKPVKWPFLQLSGAGYVQVKCTEPAGAVKQF